MLETDPVDVEMDADGDILIDADGLHLVSGIEGTAQLCLIAVRLFLGDWFLNRAVGVPWFEDILGQKFERAVLHARIGATLSKVPNVVAITSVTSAILNRRVTGAWTVQTAFGEITGTTTIGGGNA